MDKLRKQKISPSEARIPDQTGNYIKRLLQIIELFNHLSIYIIDNL